MSRRRRACRRCGGPKEPGRGRRVCDACREAWAAEAAELQHEYERRYRARHEPECPKLCERCGERPKRRAKGAHYCEECAARCLAENTARRHRRVKKRVSNEPFRVVFQRSHESPSDLARRLGWMMGDRADSGRVLRRLGLARNFSKGPQYQATMNRATAERMMVAMGVDPVDVNL